jgi:putative ABC transport system permease protein
MFREWLSIVHLRILALLYRRRLDRDLEEELAFHLASRGEGARLRFGNPTVYKEEIREMWTFRWLEVLGQDLRYATRTLIKSPGFTLMAALTLALGIGANTAIFSVVNAVILRPLPYKEPSRLVFLIGNVKRAQVERRGTSSADYLDWRRLSNSFEGMSIISQSTLTLTGTDEAEPVVAEYVSQAYFPMLGVRPAAGRVFGPAEDEVPQRDPVVVISNGIWKRRFGGDPGIVGKSILLDSQPYTVLGIMPPWFRGVYDSSDLWMPFMMAVTPQSMMDRGSRGSWVLAKLKPGVGLQQAQSEMNAVSKQLETASPGTNEGRGVEISPLETEVLGNLHTPLVVLLVAVGMVLMIACTNVANLLLARSEARHREIAVRIALGAGRGRVLHQLTTESFLLVFAGAAAGLVLADFGAKALVAASPISFPGYIQPDLDPMVTHFTVAISCVAAFALGLSPAIQVRAGNLHESVKQSGTRTINSRRGSRFRNTLVVAEVAFAMLLLVGAGLLIRSMRELSSIRPGYDPSHLLTLRVNLPGLPASPTPGGAPDTRSAVMARDIIAAAAAVPSVEIVALGTDVPMAGGNALFYTAEGQPPVNATNMPRAFIHRATPNFFQALHIRFVAGRTFTQAEMQPNSTAVIVSENLVKRFWPEQDPIGKRIKAGGPSSTNPWMSIVGVVNEMKYRGLPNNPTADPDIFAPFADNARGLTLLVRTPLDPASIAASVRHVLRTLDSTTVISSVTTMQELMSQQTARNRFTGWIMGIFAAAALLLAMIGTYGVMSYAVSQRTQEIGIRMALGAARTEVLGLMVRGGMLLVAVGLALGVAASLGLTRLLGTLLYGVTSTDTLTFAGAAVTLATVALLACLVPAARATRIHPASALRNE